MVATIFSTLDDVLQIQTRVVNLRLVALMTTTPIQVVGFLWQHGKMVCWQLHLEVVI